jgi:hypothetical protein
MNDPKDIHRSDQTGAAIRDIASQVGIYFKCMVSLGMTRAEALQLTISYQTQLLQNIYSSAREIRLEQERRKAQES